MLIFFLKNCVYLDFLKNLNLDKKAVSKAFYLLIPKRYNGKNPISETQKISYFNQKNFYLFISTFIFTSIFTTISKKNTTSLSN